MGAESQIVPAEKRGYGWNAKSKKPAAVREETGRPQHDCFRLRLRLSSYFPFDFPPCSGYLLLFRANSFAEPEEWLSG